MNYFYGPNTYAAREAISEHAKSLSATIHWLDRDELTQQPLSHWLAQGQGLFGKAVYVVRDPLALPAALQATILDAIATKPPGAVIFWDRSAPDKRSKVWHALKKYSQEFPSLHGSALSLWIKNQVPSSVTIDDAAITYLIQNLGVNQDRLANELRRLSLSNSHITLDVVTATVPLITPGNIFSLLTSVVTGQTGQTVHEWLRLRDEGHSEFYLLSMLAWQWRTMIIVKDGILTGLNDNAIVTQGKLKLFVVQKIRQQIARCSLDQLRDGLTKILATDVAIKQGMDARTAVPMLLLSLANAH